MKSQGKGMSKVDQKKDKHDRRKKIKDRITEFSTQTTKARTHLGWLSGLKNVRRKRP